MSQRFLVIVPGEDRTAANAMAKSQLDPRGGEKTFAIGLSPTGQAPATHHWCSMVLKGDAPDKLLAARTQIATATILPYDADKDATFPKRTIAGLGLKPVDLHPKGKCAWPMRMATATEAKE